MRPIPSRAFGIALTGIAALGLGADAGPARAPSATAPDLHAQAGRWYNLVPSPHHAATAWFLVPAALPAAAALPATAPTPAAPAARATAPAAAPAAAPPPAPPTPPAATPASAAAQEEPDRRYEFYFTRAAYTGGGRGWRRRRAWATDFPEADQHFVYGVRRLSYVDAYQLDNPVRLDDPELRRYPFLYAVEVGYMALTDAEVEGLRSYLEAGGFLVVDDFWGEYEWANFEHNIRKVLPGRPIVELGLDHPLYSIFYQIDEIVQVPNIGNAWRGGPTWECYGCTPHVRGIYDDAGRLMVLIHFNTDLGDAWEWADDPRYPIRYSTYAYQVGVNMIIYAMTH